MINMNFKEPGMEYAGTDLWMLNDKLEDRELERQMEEMIRAGCGAFIARTFIGLISDYPGENYLQKIGTIVNKAKETGLKVFLQAGYMPGRVAGLPEEYTHTAVKEVKAEEYNETDGKVITERDGVKYCITLVEHYLDLLNPDAMKYYMKTAYTDIWERFRDEFGKTITSVWVDEPHFNPPCLPWTAKLPESFEKAWGYRIEDNIPSLFYKDGDYGRVRYHYWRTILSLLKSAYFKEVSLWCKENNLRFSGHLMGEDALKTQIGFSASVMPLYKYMDLPGIDFLTGDTTWSHGAPYGFDRYNSVMTPLQCVGASHQAGKSDILCEMYGVSTQGLTFSDQRYFLDYFTALGVTHRCVHGMFYSLRGRRKRIYAPHFSYYQPWWNEYRNVTDYCRRVSWFMRQGKPMADILVLHPVESAFMEYESDDMADIYYKNAEQLRNAGLKIDRMNLQLKALLNDMLGMQLSFELGDEDTLAEWGEILENGMLKVGHMSYRTVVMPYMHVIRESTMRLLQQFAEKGGKVIAIDRIPGMVDGRADGRCCGFEGIKAVSGIDGLKSILTEVCPCEYSFESDDDSSLIWINMRDNGEGRSLFIFNTDRNRGRKGILKVKGRYKAEEWKGESGGIENMIVREENGLTLVDISLDAGGSRMIVLKKVDEAKSIPCMPDIKAMDDSAIIRSIKIQGKWDMKRKNPNVLPLEFCSYKKGEGEYSLLCPILAVQQILTGEGYKGEVTLKFNFNVDWVPENIRLVMEEPEKYRLKINGKATAVKKTGEYYLEKSFEVVDISGTIEEGANTIEASRYFEPLQEAASSLSALFESLSGVELESFYLIGDFGVYSSAEPTNTGCIKLNRNFHIGMEKDRVGRELVLDGYPFYAGTAVLEKVFFINGITEGEKVVVKVDGFRGCVGNVYINDVNAGKLCWEPYEADVTGKLLKGENRITIELANTLRNLLGPYHRPEGELPHCWYVYPWTGEFDSVSSIRHNDWYKDRVPDTVTWTESYMQLPFGIDSVKMNFF